MENIQKWGNELTRRTTCEVLKSQTCQGRGFKYNKDRKPVGKAELQEKKA